MGNLEPATILLYGGAVLAGVCWVVVFYRVSGEDRAMGKMCYLFPPMAPFWTLFHLGEFKFEAAGFVAAAGLVAASFADWRRLDGPPPRGADTNTAANAAAAPRTAPDPAKPERPPSDRGLGPEPVPLDRATRGLVADPDPGRVTPYRPPSGDARPPPEPKGAKHGAKPAKHAPEPAPMRVPVITATSDVAGMTVPELIEGLKAKPVAVRTRAIFELAKRGAAAEDALPELTKLLGDADASIRDAAEFAIRKIRNP